WGSGRPRRCLDGRLESGFWGISDAATWTAAGASRVLGHGPGFPRCALEDPAQPLPAFVLQLPDALSGDSQSSADLAERKDGASVESEAVDDHRLLLIGQMPQRATEQAVALPADQMILGMERPAVRQDVRERRVGVVPDRIVEGDLPQLQLED